MPSSADDHKLITKVEYLHWEGASLRQIATKAAVAMNTVRKILAAT